MEYLDVLKELRKDIQQLVNIGKPNKEDIIIKIVKQIGDLEEKDNEDIKEICSMLIATLTFKDYASALELIDLKIGELKR